MHSPNFVDLTNQHFGFYVVLGEAPSHIQPNGNIVTMWYCRCICGKIKIVAGNHLKSRPNISCGCQKKTTLKDLTGYTNEYIKVESRAPGQLKGNGKYRTMWNCICLACGNRFVETSYQITSGKRKSCGCLVSKIRSKMHLNDLTKTKHGRLFIESRADDYVKPSGSKDTMWNCICDCGNRCVKRGQYITSSKNPSCGCWKSEETHRRRFTDLTGELINNLYVWEYYGSIADKKGNKTNRFLCECLLCNSYCVKKYSDLVNGTVISCGCFKESRGEKITRSLLMKHKIKYEKEYSFDDLISTKGYPLRFDFAIFDDFKRLICLIEYQGQQHYENVEFGKQQREKTDQQKREYCFAHNIPLYEIKYDENVENVINKIISIHVNSVPSPAV